MEKVLDLLRVGVILLDSRGRIAYANPFCVERELLAKDHKGKFYYEVFRSLELIGAVEDFLEGKELSAELTFKDRHYVLNFNQDIRLIQIQDVTEVHRSRRSQKEFLAYVSHELSTPITAIKGLLETALLAERPNHDMLKRAVVRLEEMGELLKSLRLFILSDSPVSLRLEEAKLLEVIKGVVIDLMPLAREKNVHVNLNVHENISIRTDKEKLYILLRNVLENAIKYNVEGGTVSLSVEAEKDRIKINVEDTGIGIPSSELPFVFEPFFGGKNRKGMGLGLSISKKMVELLGGEITIESEEGVGTRVKIELPQTSNL